MGICIIDSGINMEHDDLAPQLRTSWNRVSYTVGEGDEKTTEMPEPGSALYKYVTDDDG